jgi:hypothetical protein
MAAALTSFYLEPEKVEIGNTHRFLCGTNWYDAFEYLLFSSVSGLFSSRTSQSSVAKFYNDTRYLGYGIGF